MGVVVVSGAAGLVGSEAVTVFADRGLDVVSIDNDLRRTFFGTEASTGPRRAWLQANVRGYTHHAADIRDHAAMEAVFAHYSRAIAGIVHAAAQPSHDWATREPVTDFTINANGTLVLLELTRKHCPDTIAQIAAALRDRAR